MLPSFLGAMSFWSQSSYIMLGVFLFSVIKPCPTFSKVGGDCKPIQSGIHDIKAGITCSSRGRLLGIRRPQPHRLKRVVDTAPHAARSDRLGL